MFVGFLGLVYGFLTVPDTVEEASAMVADVHHGEDHGEGHDGVTQNDYRTRFRLGPTLNRSCTQRTTDHFDICAAIKSGT